MLIKYWISTWQGIRLIVGRERKGRLKPVSHYKDWDWIEIDQSESEEKLVSNLVNFTFIGQILIQSQPKAHGTFFNGLLAARFLWLVRC